MVSRYGVSILMVNMVLLADIKNLYQDVHWGGERVWGQFGWAIELLKLWFVNDKLFKVYLETS